MENLFLSIWLFRFMITFENLHLSFLWRISSASCPFWKWKIYVQRRFEINEIKVKHGLLLYLDCGS